MTGRLSQKERTWMRVAVAAIVVAAGTAHDGGRATLRAQAQAARTVWDGVYSREQQQRGRALYDERCSSCHGTELGGGEMAPSLAGGAFQSNWDSLSVGDLAERIRISMPQGNEGTLSRQQVSDVMAAIFAVNEYPAAQMELPKELEPLKLIQITSRKP
jgi:mono/diheme cytochrome c family protein